MTDPQPKEWRRFSVSALDFRGRDETIEVIELAALDELRREIEWLQDEIINLRLLKDPEIVDDVKDISIAHLRNVIERLKAKLAECEAENAVELDRMKRWNDENADHAQRFLVERDHARDAYDNAMDQVNSLKAKLSLRDKQLAIAKDALKYSEGVLRDCTVEHARTLAKVREALAEIEKLETDHDQAK